MMMAVRDGQTTAAGRVNWPSVAAALCAAALAASVFLTWYSSQALIDFDRYVGNPLPAVDWIVAATAILAVGERKLWLPAGVIGLVSAGMTAYMMYYEAAEGLEVSLDVGLVVAFAASVGLLLSRRWHRASRAESRPASPRATAG